jgi:PIN domain nuclease of toxin-antitoxin system
MTAPHDRVVLIDTAVVVYLETRPNALSSFAKDVMQRKTARRYLSMVSLWEIAIKNGIGKLPLDDGFADLAARWAGRDDLELLTLSLPVINRVPALPLIHRDPFDRLLACQFQELDVAILSPDPVFDAYGILRMW